MKHNLRMAFLSLLLVLTLGVMPVFAESADHAMDWTHGIGSRYTAVMPDGTQVEGAIKQNPGRT